MYGEKRTTIREKKGREWRRRLFHCGGFGVGLPLGGETYIETVGRRASTPVARVLGYRCRVV